MRVAALRRALAAALLAASHAMAANFAGVEVAPPLPPDPVTDVHWGVSVADPYRFLENTADPKVQAWMRAQADATNAILARLPGRAKLLERIAEIDAAVPAVVSTIRRDSRGRLTYLKRGATENQFKLYRRDTPEGPDRLLVDPEALMKATGKTHAIDGFEPSPDGALVAYAVSSGGAEIGTLHVIDAATGKEVTPAIDRVRGGGAVAWLPDGSGFFHARLAPGWEQRPRNERFMDQRTSLRLLSDPAADRVVFGTGVHDAIPLDRSEHAYLVPVRGQDAVFAVVRLGVQRETSVYRARLSAVIAGKGGWQKLFDARANVQDAEPGGAWLYLRSAEDAPRYKVLRMPIAGTFAEARVILPPSDTVITGIAPARDALYVTRRAGVVERLERVSHEEAPRASPVALPVEGTVGVAFADPGQDGVFITLGGWTRATRSYAVEANAVRDLALVPPGRFDAPEGIESREVKVRSHDGTEVPASIILAKGTKLDGRNPLLLYGYGAYGIVEEPSYAPRVLAWLERGGIFVVAHVRGGGVYGDAWRRAGWKSTKPNTWKDGIAVGEWLIANGYTSKDKLAIVGGSAGGIFVGRAITERPDLFAAAAIVVGNLDSMRSETRANGAGNIPEYGTVTKEDEFRALLAMSPYANVKPGTRYPAVLLEHGVNDTRVDVWMALKFASRLAADSTSGAPILLRLDYDSGHGPGRTRRQAQEQTADRWSFFLWRTGDPDFQPPPETAKAAAGR